MSDNEFPSLDTRPEGAWPIPQIVNSFPPWLPRWLDGGKSYTTLAWAHMLGEVPPQDWQRSLDWIDAAVQRGLLDTVAYEQAHAVLGYDAAHGIVRALVACGLPDDP